MDITFFSVTRDNNPFFAESKKIISDCVNAFAGQPVKIKNFSSPKRMLVSASQALRSTDAVVIAVQMSMYNTVKKMICTSLDLHLKRIGEIYDGLYALYDKGQISEAALNNNSLFPPDADIFPTQDLLCCGFSVIAGAQSIIVLPLDPIKTAETVFGSLYGFFAEFGGMQDQTNMIMFKRAAMMTRIVNLLRQSGSKLMFLPLGGKTVIADNMKIADPDCEYISFAEIPEARKADQTAKDYIVSAVQKARVENGADYVCAVSSAFASNKDDTVFVLHAECDENDTVVTKLFANPGETPKAASESAVENALMLAGSKIMKNILSEEQRRNKPDRILKMKLAVISAAAIAGAALISTALAVLLNQ